MKHRIHIVTCIYADIKVIGVNNIVLYLHREDEFIAQLNMKRWRKLGWYYKFKKEKEETKWMQGSILTYNIIPAVEKFLIDYQIEKTLLG